MNGRMTTTSIPEIRSTQNGREPTRHGRNPTRLAKEFLAKRVSTEVSFAEADRDYERREDRFKRDDQADSAKSCLIMFLIPAGVVGVYGITQGSGVQCLGGIGLIAGYFLVRHVLINSYYDNLG
jgi:hypothetical protein